MNSSGRGRERVLLAVGTNTYRYGADFAEPLANLDQVPDALRWIVETLTGLGYQSKLIGDRKYLLNPSLQRLKQAIRAVAGAASVVVVYYTGHGVKPDRSPYYLVTTGAKPGRLGDTALEARQLLDLVLRRDTHGEAVPDEEQPEVLVILDCCFSGAGGSETLRESLQVMGNPKVWVLTTASSVEYAQQGRFAAALRQALLDPDAGRSQELLGLDWITDKVNATLGRARQTARYSPPGGESGGLPPFFPNPKYVPDVAGLTVAAQHWVSRLRGAPPTGATAGFYVTGRAGRVRAAEDLAAWMRHQDRDGLAVVTGSPGSGKSAMLALPVLLADAQRRDALVAGTDQRSLVARAVELFDGLPVLGIHARGMDLYHAADAIAQYLGRPAGSLEELFEDLEDRPATSSQTLVIDAVDEARDPRRLMTDLLLPLANRPGLAVVVGARRHIVPSAADISLMIDLDSDHYRDPEALVDYAYQLLVAAHEPDVSSPYRDQDDGTITEVAAGIAEKATARPTATGQAESFLLAQLLARAVRSRPQVLDVKGAGWTEQLPADVGAAFDEDLLRLGKREPTARVLLAALAWARGAGLPWEAIWVPVAQALAALTGTRTLQLDEDHVRWLLNKAGAYVVEDVGLGQRSVFRPFHDLLAAHLREQPSDERTATDPTARDDWQQRRRRVEKDITDALLAVVPTYGQTRDWGSAHPYLRSYLAQHAAAAVPNRLPDLVRDPGFLPTADPGILTALLLVTIPELRDIARTYRRVRPLLGDDFRANAAYLNEAAFALTGMPASMEGAIRPLYRTHLASVRQDDSLLTLAGHDGQVLSVAFGTGPDGLLLASGSSDGTVRLWDPSTGTSMGEPLTGHDGQVLSVAFGTGHDGQLLLASGGWDNTVRLWDPVTGTQIQEAFTGHSGHVLSVAFGTGPDRQLLLASASSDRTVRLWDPVAGVPVGRPLAGHTGQVQSVAFGIGPDGQLLLASASWDKTVRLWDPVTGSHIGEPLTGHNEVVLSVAFGTGPDGRPLLASGSDDRTVRLWDPIDGVPVGKPLRGHSHQVLSVAFGTGPDGRPLLASGSWDKTLRMWDPINGVPVGKPLAGHTAPVLCAAFDSGPAGLLLASGSRDKTVRLWDPAASTRMGKPLIGHSDRVGSVAFCARPDGGLLLASGSNDQTVRLWDSVTGAAVGESLAGHAGRVRSVAFGARPDGRLLLASGSNDQTVRLWDPATGAPMSEALTGHTDKVFSVAFGARPDGRLLLASGSNDQTVRLWDPVTGGPIGEPLSDHSGPVLCVAFGTGRNGLLLASGSRDRTVRLWDLVTGTAVSTALTGHREAVASVAFGMRPGGRLLLASGSWDNTVRLWDPATGIWVDEILEGHSDAVFSLAFGIGADGRRLLASGSRDRTVRLWDLGTLSCLAVIHRRSEIHSLATANKRLAIGDQEGVSVIELTV